MFIASSRNHYFFILIVAALLFVPYLGTVHLFDWDEINFAECAREMIVSKNYAVVTINYLPFWEKPPLFIWMQVLSMKTFGINEFAARFPNAVCGIVTLLMLFKIGKKIHSQSFGYLWTITFGCSILPFFYFKSGIIDPWFNLFIFLGIYYAIDFTFNNATKQVVLAALFIGLAIMTKGPVALLIFILCCGTIGFMCAVQRKKYTCPPLRIWLYYTAVLASVGGLWGLLLWTTGNAHVLGDFIRYQIRLFSTQDAGHGGPFYYHFIVLLLGCFPASIFAIRAMLCKRDNSTATVRLQQFKKWMLVLFWVVLILFSIVKTKIIHYSSLCYFPITFLAAYTLLYIKEKKITHIAVWMRILLYCITITFGALYAMLPLIDRFKEKIIASNLIDDPFAIENLKATVQWTGWEYCIGLGFIIATCVWVYLFSKTKKIQFGVAIFMVNVVAAYLCVIIITPRIEQYSQAAAINFFEKIAKEKSHIQVLGYMSYANYFYGQTTATENINQLLNDTTKTTPIYFVSKTTFEKNVKSDYLMLQEVQRKNGFILWKKK